MTLLKSYLNNGILSVNRMGRRYVWLDTGAHGSFTVASNFVCMLQERQGLQTGCPEEIAYLQGWITKQELSDKAYSLSKITTARIF